MKDKIVTADEAVALIRDGDSVCCSGFVGIGTPDELIMALERRFAGTAEPRNLTLVFAAAPGDGRDRGSIAWHCRGWSNVLSADIGRCCRSSPAWRPIT